MLSLWEAFWYKEKEKRKKKKEKKSISLFAIILQID
jgi:hypothetical protein